MGKSRRGFSLIELLVVVTIIVLLLALLSPALDQAIESAQRAVCAANLHRFGLAHNYYATDNKKRLLRVVSFSAQNDNRFYPSVSRNTDSQGPGQWSGEKMAPYVGGVELNAPIPVDGTTGLYTGTAPVSGGTPAAGSGLYGKQWYCPSNGKNAAKDLGNQLSSSPPGTESAWITGWMALDYAYFARVPADHASFPEQLIDHELVSGKLLMADVLYYWQGGSHDGWWFNHHIDGPSVHDYDRNQWGGPCKRGKEIRGLMGTNQLFGDVAVIWKDSSKFNPNLMWSPSTEVGFVSGGPGPAPADDLCFY